MALPGLDDRLVQIFIGSYCSFFNSSPIWHHFDAFSNFATVAVQILEKINNLKSGRNGSYSKDRLRVLSGLEKLRTARIKEIAVISVEGIVELVGVFGQV